MKRDAFNFKPLAQFPEEAGANAVVHRRDIREDCAGLGQLPQDFLKALSDHEEQRLTAREKIQADGFNTVNAALLGGGLISVLMAIVMGWWLTRAIARPVTRASGLRDRLWPT